MAPSRMKNFCAKQIKSALKGKSGNDSGDGYIGDTLRKAPRVTLLECHLNGIHKANEEDSAILSKRNRCKTWRNEIQCL